MIDHPKMRPVLGHLQEVTQAGGALPLEAVGRAVGATYTLLFAERAADGQIEHPVLQGVDHAYGNRLRIAAEQRLLPQWLRGLKSGEVIDRAALQRDHDFMHSEFFNYVVRPEGRFHCLIATPHVTLTQRYHLIVGRPANKQDFTPADAQLLSALMPFMGHAIRLEADRTHAQSSAGNLMAAFDCMAETVFILTQSGRVEFANSGAERLLALRDGLSVTDCVLQAADPMLNAILRRAIQQVAAVGQTEVGLHLPRPSGCAPLQLRLVRLPALPHAALPRIMLLVQQPDPEAMVDGWSVGQIYGLTPKELDIAVLLTRGLSLRAAAQQLGMGYSTARSHLRRAFEKTDTHRQSDLVRMVLRGSPRLRR